MSSKNSAQPADDVAQPAEQNLQQAVSSAVPAQAHWLVFNNANHPITIELSGGQGQLVLGPRRRETVIGQPVTLPQGVVAKQLD